ncbi:MAG TPA: alpha/beta fold hydrolase [Burkholderiaceae bacterium]|nr:alpha/beta fold hydrolase [Burkholderiaceae bacterium]
MNEPNLTTSIDPGSMLECVELQTRPAPNASIIWLHGLGADGFDFVPVVRELEALGAPAARYVFPHAPQRAVTINGGMVMRAWFDILDASIDRREDPGGIRQSQTQVEALIEREVARGTARSRIVLAGFSQGGAIALQTGLRQPQALAALVVLSAYLPLAQSAAAEATAAARSTPIFMAHGHDDNVIPIGRAESSRAALVALGFRVQWHEYAIPHSVSAEEIRDLAAFLGEALK